ncbi:MAG: MFS transporter, partial [Promethearchaeota archaeon]
MSFMVEKAKVDSLEKDLKTFKINEGKVFFALKLSMFNDILGYSLIFPILPAVAIKYGSSDLFYGLMIAVNALFTFLFAPIWGKLSDRFGRKNFLIICQFGTLIAFLMFGLSNSLMMILITRILDGVFGGQTTI